MNEAGAPEAAEAAEAAVLRIWIFPMQCMRWVLTVCRQVAK